MEDGENKKARLLSNFPSYKKLCLIEDMNITYHCINQKRGRFFDKYNVKRQH